jgi:hypothetical protein
LIRPEIMGFIILKGYNVFIMAFWNSTQGAVYKASEFTELSQSTRNWIINDYHAHNISFLVSAFGYGDNPTTNREDPVTVANNLAAFVKKYDVRTFSSDGLLLT